MGPEENMYCPDCGSSDIGFQERKDEKGLTVWGVCHSCGRTGAEYTFPIRTMINCDVEMKRHFAWSRWLDENA